MTDLQFNNNVLELFKEYNINIRDFSIEVVLDIEKPLYLSIFFDDYMDRKGYWLHCKKEHDFIYLDHFHEYLNVYDELIIFKELILPNYV